MSDVTTALKALNDAATHCSHAAWRYYDYLATRPALAAAYAAYACMAGWSPETFARLSSVEHELMFAGVDPEGDRAQYLRERFEVATSYLDVARDEYNTVSRQARGRLAATHSALEEAVDEYARYLADRPALRAVYEAYATCSPATRAETFVALLRAEAHHAGAARLRTRVESLRQEYRYWCQSFALPDAAEAVAA